MNDKSDEDAEERRNSADGGRSTSQPSALLSQLLSSNGPSASGRSQEETNNYLEKIAGVKRKLEEAKAANNAKRSTPDSQQVSIELFFSFHFTR